MFITCKGPFKRYVTLTWGGGGKQSVSTAPSLLGYINGQKREIGRGSGGQNSGILR